MAIFHCRRCGESFKVSGETLKLIEEGYIEEPEICPDCQFLEDMCEEEYFQEFSDADPGL